MKNNNESNSFRVITKKNKLYLVTRDDNATLNDIYVNGFIINESGKMITDEMPIGTLTKDGYWEEIIDDKTSSIITGKDNYVKDALIGAAIGDAFGVPYEFLTRDQISHLSIDGMIGRDTNPNFYSRWSKTIPSGCWSDDTSMIVATMSSMIKCGEINYDDIMRNFISWWDTGIYSSLSFPFGLGSTIEKSFAQYKNGVPALNCGCKGYMDNGNGSLMRILPFSLYCIKNNLNEIDTFNVISSGSSLTHANEISIMACYMYTIFLREVIRTKNKSIAFSKMIYTNYYEFFSKNTIEKFKKIINPNFNIQITDIQESGYVVDTLEAVIYSIIKGKNYKDVIEICIKIGYDTDTIACIAGSLAGVIYGYDNIPNKWLDKLRKRETLEKLSIQFDKCISYSNSKNNFEL